MSALSKPAASTRGFMSWSGDEYQGRVGGGGDVQLASMVSHTA